MKISTKKLLFSALFLTSLNINLSFAQGGMWTPDMLPTQEKNMRDLGLKIPIEKIYSENKNSLNHTIALYGRGCSSELISPQGLLLTNHHCAYSDIQSLSTTDRNILTDGYWASNQSEELPVPGLTVRFIRKIEDVTKDITYGLNDTMDLNIREKRITNRIEKLEKSLSASSGYQVEIKAFYYGNEYKAIYVETFKDVRLVGTPPNGIGKFGADTDNWMWPRMTGDFALLRVYADANNKPADYHPNNKPYRSKNYLPISTKGVKENDFTMVYGFPFRTMQYISSYELGLIEDYLNPIRINSRHVRLGVLNKEMRKDPEIFLKYAAKQSSISNGYKKWQGELQGLAKNQVRKKKELQERNFTKWANQIGNDQYKILLPRISAQVQAAIPFLEKNEDLQETVLSIEIIQRAKWLQDIITTLENDPKKWEETKASIIKEAENFYKDYDLKTDKKVFEATIDFYFNKTDVEPIPALKSLKFNAGNSETMWSNYIYSSSVLKNKEQLLSFLNQANTTILKQAKTDPAYQVYNAAKEYQSNEVKPRLDIYNQQMAHLNRLYMKAQMEHNPENKAMFPDANQTMRITYGQVKAIDLQTSNQAVTTLEDLIPRHNSQIEEFNIPSKLRALYQVEDYGRWKRNGTVPINFIATNHTSGGNSGSAVLNGKGELIGLNFDRIWQGTMSDIHFDPNLSRHISVDILYVLFIIEKYGDAGWLLKEMELRK